MGSSPVKYPFRYDIPEGQLRLALAPSFGRSPVDGAWWPWSRDLLREAPHLVDCFPVARGRIDRMAYVVQDWEVPESPVYTKFGRLKTGGLPPTQRGFVLLRLSPEAGARVIRVRLVRDRDRPAVHP